MARHSASKLWPIPEHFFEEKNARPFPSLGKDSPFDATLEKGLGQNRPLHEYICMLLWRALADGKGENVRIWPGKGGKRQLCDLLFSYADGLTDCEDPECCESPVCGRSQLCHSVPAPIDILLRKHPPASTASFFERMKFIIEDKGMQSYVRREGFNER